MKACHLILGLPRSGSTLLCVLLNQNPDFYATASSDTPEQIAAISRTWGGLQSTSMRAHDEQLEQASEVESVRGFVTGKYFYVDQPVLFEKSRAWGEQWLSFRQIFPGGKAIICVRDLRAVIGSILKRDSIHPLLSLFPQGVNTPEQKASYLCSADQMVGMAVRNTVACHKWAKDQALTLRHERWTAEPERYMRKLYQHIGRDYFPHDFVNVKGHGGELDALLSGKYPHKVYGPVAPGNPHEWRQYVSPDISNNIRNLFAEYYKILDEPDEWETKP